MDRKRTQFKEEIIMSLRINSNIAAMNAYRNLSSNDKMMQSSLEKLSSGLRINKAADDAAGLSISQGLQAQIGGLTVAARNAQDGVNVVQIADGALTETSAILQRMRDLAVQAANAGSQDTDARTAAQTEVTQLIDELDRIADTTAFGGQKLLDQAYNGTFQVGANSGESISVDLTAQGFDAAGLGVDAIDLIAVGAADAAITTLDTAITDLSTARANLGAYQNRFEHTINNLNVQIENLSASKSAITDTDMAQEMVKFTRSQILSQAGTAMLAQANQAPQSVLQLLRG
ncbi:MAG TPA: flagellin [Actinophytocola sp.]|uniref:flagellin N-terminal helical domain-containing protein n=1 Tax=Actinophytocola sp. TaxID=1872138 RepID=UPI002DBB148C|nr:flagellin [Actinophytocola sp.]HEU5474203.1 flagellin [Actinophytocola sp.]